MYELRAPWLEALSFFGGGGEGCVTSHGWVGCENGLVSMLQSNEIEGHIRSKCH